MTTYQNQNFAPIAEVWTHNKDLAGLQSLGQFLKNGGQLAIDMPVIMERSMRAPMEAGTVESWHIGSAEFDPTGLGQYSLSNAVIKNSKTGAVEPWPFTMLYVNESVFYTVPNQKRPPLLIAPLGICALYEKVNSKDEFLFSILGFKNITKIDNDIFLGTKQINIKTFLSDKGAKFNL